MNNRLIIVLPTYNGGRYLAEQIESIRSQTIDTWELLVRDDGSTDTTFELIKKYAEEDERVVLIEDQHGNLGAAGNFSLLVELALKRGADYIAFSDQDDIWLPYKLEMAMSRMHSLEQQYGMNIPVMVHSDLEIVSESLETISPSFMQYENINNPGNPSINKLLIQNYVVGCTMLGNRSLLEAATPVPSSVRMHDWWFASYSVVAGELSYLPAATIRYRQHSSNTLGVGGFAQIYNPFSRAWRKRLLKRPMLQRASTRLAEALTNRLVDKKNNSQLHLLNKCKTCFYLYWGVSRVLCAKKARMGGQNKVASFIFYSLLLFARFR